MATLLRHRGPDDEGFLAVGSDGMCVALAGKETDAAVLASDAPFLPRHGSAAGGGPLDVVLAARRLAILDLSPLGHQPLASTDGRVWIVHNGEIYNYLELRTELESAGHRFRGHSDTEVALAAYREWGVGCFERFNGMWAQAIWDSGRRTLVLSRDRFGVKPLYVADAGEGVAFASEIKALVGAGFVRPSADEPAVAAFLATGRIDADGERTCFAGVRQVLPGTFVELPLEGAGHTTRYYDVVAGAAGAGDRDLGVLIRDAVAIRLRSDVPVGSCLSGGTDSSAIVALAQARRTGDVPISTFTFSSPEPGQDDWPFARIAAEHVGARSFVVGPPENDLVALLERVAVEQDEPLGSGSVLAQRQVMGLAHEQGLKVLLDGQGGDEVLAGYGYYVAARLADLAARGRVGAWTREVAAARGTGQSLAWLTRATVGELRRPAVAGERLRRLQIDDLLHHLPALLHYEDRNSMAVSIETRLPFLDYRLVELGLALPGDEKLRDGWTKLALRRAIEHDLPESIVWRRDKMQFSAPQAAWLAGPLSELADDLLAAPAVVPPAAAGQLRATLHDPGGRVTRGDELWRAFAAELWHRTWISRRTA